MFSAWYFPGWAVLLGSSHASYARYHYWIPLLVLTIVTVGTGLMIEVAELNQEVSQRRKNPWNSGVVVLGFIISSLGVIVGTLKGSGIVFFAAMIVVLAILRMSFAMSDFLNRVIHCLGIILIYLAVIFKYQVPDLKILTHQSSQQALGNLWVYLGAVFLFTLGCQLLPQRTGKIRGVLFLMIGQPLVVVPFLLKTNWEWHASFLIPMSFFGLWFGAVVWAHLAQRDCAKLLANTGRPLVDFLVLGSVGFALLFKLEGGVSVFNSYTMRTLLVLLPSYFFIGLIFEWLRSKALISGLHEER